MKDSLFTVPLAIYNRIGKLEIGNKWRIDEKEKLEHVLANYPTLSQKQINMELRIYSTEQELCIMF